MISTDNGKRLTIVWLVLSAVTLISLGLAPPLARATMPDMVLTISVIVVSLLKVRFVLQEFMEVRHTPAFLSWITDAWLIATAGLLVGGFYAGSTWLGS